MKKILIISPHLDDAVLSCGDLINKITNEDNEVDVLTIFSKKEIKKNLSKAALKFHSNCFLDDNAMDYRKSEDMKAHKCLKCNSLYLDMLECLYRKDNKGHFYPDLDNIYYLNDKDKKTIKILEKKLLKYVNNYDVVLCPLGLGNHADHIITNTAINNIRSSIKGKLFFYEDVAYVCYYYRNHDTSNWGQGLKNIIIDIAEEDFEKKIESILLYRSQLNILWENYYQMYEDLDLFSKKYGNTRKVRIWYYDNL